MVTEPDQKSQMLSFRLSSEEYKALKKLYRHYGAQSVSEFARDAISRLISEVPRPETVQARLDGLEQRVSVLEIEFARLMELLEHPVPDSAARAAGV